MKGCVYNAWSVSMENGLSYFTNDEIGEFDYAQSGYKIFVAHQKHAPSEIWTNERLVDAAVSSASEISPFTWEKFDISGIDSGIPSITGATQSRIAPSEDSAGGTYTEKYKVSAVFDDIETKPCSEFYNESCIGPVSLSAKSESGGTCIQRSESTTPSYKSVTVQSDGISKSTTTVAEVKSVSASYSNKIAAECSGTKYYLPWVESQSIKLSVKAVGNGKQSYPDSINVYKKASGYYGLIGTIRVSESGVAGEVYKSVSTENALKTNSAVAAGSKQSAIIYDSETSANIVSLYDDVHGSERTGYSIGTKGSITITPYSLANETTAIKLYLGKACITLNSWDSSGRPTGSLFSFVTGSSTVQLLVTASLEYVNTDGDTVTATASGTTDLTYSSYGNSQYTANSYSTFSKNYKTKYNTWLGGLTGNDTATIDLSSVLTNLPTDKKTGTTFSITKITIVPTNGILTFNGVAATQNSLTEFEFTDNNITPDTSITPISADYEAPFNCSGNYPATVAVYQQRLVWASSINDPETVWMSAVGDFYDYSEHEIQSDSDAIEFSMPVTRFAKLNHIVEMKRLLAFNSACEWLIDSSSSVKGITYETIRAMPQSYSGSNSRMKPLICNNSVVFSERTGQSVRRFAYNIQDDGFAGKDVSILAASIFEHNTIIDWTYQQHPFSTIWCVLSDGTLASLEIMEEQDIIAWATHKHGDSGARFTNVATSYAMGPSLADIDSDTDEPYELATSEEIFAIVEHGSGDEMTRTLERMRVRSKATDSIYNSLCLDSTEVATEETELKSGQVGVNATTGVVVTDGTVEAGTIIGYPFEAKFTSVYPTIGEQYVGGGQFAIKNLNNLHLRLEASDGGKVAATRIEDEAVPIRYDDDAGNDKTSVKNDGVATFYDCDAANCHPVGCNNRDGRITITQDTPWPFTLLSYEAEYVTENENYVPRVR